MFASVPACAEASASVSDAMRHNLPVSDWRKLAIGAAFASQRLARYTASRLQPLANEALSPCSLGAQRTKALAPANAAISKPGCWESGISYATLNCRAYPFPGRCAACGGGSTALGLYLCHAGKLKGRGITFGTPHSARRISTPGLIGHIKLSGCAFFLG